MNATRNVTSAEVLNRLHSFLQLACVLTVCILGILAMRAYDAVFMSDRERAIAAGVADARRHRASDCMKLPTTVPEEYSDNLKAEAAMAITTCIKAIR